MRNETTTQPHIAGGLLAGKVIAIIGASAGIGAAAARVFSREGAALMLGARSQDRLAEVAEELRGDGAEVAHHRCDIGSAADTTALVNATVTRFGRLDGAFNNAGISGNGRLADLSEVAFDELLRVNFKGIWLAMRAEIPRNAAQSPRGSDRQHQQCRRPARRAGPQRIPSHQARRDLADHHRRARLRARRTAGQRDRPGTTDTDMITAWKQRDPGIAERLHAITPLGRGAHPSEIAEAAAWLLSDRASYISGTVLAIDGGMTA
jgi:NAD(P)-dependent dehydrogenase (short-subunit alcohol dehydrogenase family)